jgi:hypothetical protein
LQQRRAESRSEMSGRQSGQGTAGRHAGQRRRHSDSEEQSRQVIRQAGRALQEGRPCRADQAVRRYKTGRPECQAGRQARRSRQEGQRRKTGKQGRA